jgi:signal transduction histidine kinase
MRPHRRTTLAAALIGVAVLLPTGAWYVTGSREVARRSQAIEAAAALTIREDVESKAARLGARLEDLRLQESVRPFFHYQTLYHDPRGASEGLAVTPSPLASGSPDPLVWAHFQIDESGLVTLPAVSEQFPELTSDADLDAFCSILGELQHALVLGQEPGHATGTTDEELLLTLTESEWEQILRADSVYASITGGQGQPSAPVASEGVGRVVIRVLPLHWHTLVLGSGPALAALREVHTPSGVLLQGFAVAPGGVVRWLGNGSLPLGFSPGPPATSNSVTSLVADTGWLLEADLSPALGAATERGRAEVRRFRSAFALTSAAILLAAAAVVWILFQMDRLATQRARFAAAAAHELKTPLAGLLLHAEMLAENLGDSEHRSRYAATVSSEADRLGRVVSNMLDLARLERATPLAAPRAGDVGRAVKQRVEQQQNRLEDAGVSVEVDIEQDLPAAMFDPDALGQILDNLLDNAEKHTRVVEKNRRVTVMVTSDEDKLQIQVADNGPGIPRSQRRTMFRPFDRSEDAIGRPGLGLGLAVARSFARAQGGELELESDDRPGATFVLTLPRA